MKRILHVPVVFGHWLIEGGRLVCRLPRKNVTVTAPKKLLVAVMHSCDGSRSWADIVGMLEVDWAAAALAPFMQALVEDGVLVEASLLWAHWADIAQLPTTTGTAATNEVINTLHQVAEARLLAGLGTVVKSIRSGNNTLAQILRKRESSRTFDDQPISVECLCSILWAAHGVTQVDETSTVAWRRTIASGGNMHSARWFVFVLRELVSEETETEPVAPGIYEARFHKLGGVSLQKTPGKVLDAWRCLLDPRVLRFASALVLPVYDLSVPAQKYGNRAALYALMESGQALQNAQLMAFELGASGMLRGDTIAHESLRTLCLRNTVSHWLSVPAMVVGAQATSKQLEQQRRENALKITPNLAVPGDSFAFSARLALAEDNLLFAAGGRSNDPKLALTKAEAECFERMAWASPVDVQSGKFKISRLNEVNDAVDPRTLVAYSKRQYADNSFPFSPFSPARRHLWADAIDVETGQVRSVIADCIYASSALPSRFHKHLFTSTSTSGMAAGTTLENALHGATLELIERDAFVCGWLSRRAPPIIKKSSLPQNALQRIKVLMQQGVRLTVSDISTAWVPVVSVFAQNDQMPFTAITAAAHFSAEEALVKALDEIEGRLSWARQFPVLSSKNTNPMWHIERFYRAANTYQSANFYIETRNRVDWRNTGSYSCQNWADLTARIFGDGFSLFFVDMTPKQASIEQGRVPLKVVRALIPGLVPIWFEDNLQPEALNRFLAAARMAINRSNGQIFIHPFT